MMTRLIAPDSLAYALNVTRFVLFGGSLILTGRQTPYVIRLTHPSLY